MTPPPSVVAGPPLAEEEGLGALTLGGFLREVTGQHGPREALVLHEVDAAGADRVTRWSYDALRAHSNAVARALMASGVGKGTRVGILMTNRPEFLSAAFGTALAGGVAATLSTFSTAAELDHLVRTAACTVLLIERSVLKRDFAAMVTALDPAIAAAAPGAIRSPAFPHLRHIVAIGEAGSDGDGAIEAWDAFIARGEAVPQALVDAAAAGVVPADPGVLFFSSGSTAKPKGVLSAHRGVALQLWRWRRYYAIADDDVRLWSANGFFWSGNFAIAIGTSLSTGGAMLLQRVFDPEEALALMAAERATMAFAWPHQWAQLEAAANWSTVDLSALRYVDARTPLGRHPTVATTWREPVAYGNTETFTISAIFPSDTPEDRIAGSHGEAQPGGTFKIVDPLSGAVVPMGERGEIAVKGPTLMLGYVGVPLDETLDDEGFFRTGDGGHLDATGRLFWHGRLNDIIKTGGANVSPVEVDAVLKAHPGVKVTQTVGLPHDTLGEVVVACIVPHENAALDEEGIRTFARASLASYKVPRRVLFFGEDELALTGSAKVKTADLKALAARRLG